MSELLWSNEATAIERGAYALAGTFRCLAYLCAGVGVFIGVAMALGDRYEVTDAAPILTMREPFAAEIDLAALVTADRPPG